ncbi:hypothetical protein [Anaeromyxobacter sp. Fw109-5]|uniref:hypothetical protein n=1 Tax=Anaeromyxobacter sp. (strain Fw109-5) TaxID=404589 RepID=UPI0002F4A1BF|nr:hypothetical protein [Anaeromyxobacter sp. Fw109-5]
MKRLLLACAAAALVAATAQAQTALPRHVFVAVDALEIRANLFTVTGVLDGESEARAVTFTFSSSSTSSERDDVAACQRLALLAMTRPGQFRFEVAGGTTYYQYPACKLARVTP